jgi:hypothetical protein
MENGTVQKGQNLLEDFVWPIDTGRLMGDSGTDSATVC